MTLNNVTIGDKFIDTVHRKSKRVSTVIDFTETRSMTTGEHINYHCIASHKFMGQTMTKEVCFVTVLRNKVTDTPK